MYHDSASARTCRLRQHGSTADVSDDDTTYPERLRFTRVDTAVVASRGVQEQECHLLYCKDTCGEMTTEANRSNNSKNKHKKKQTEAENKPYTNMERM